MNAHRQENTYTCIPMSIEFVLKLLGRLDPNDFCLQTAWNNRSDGSGGSFDGKAFYGVRFHQLFTNPRDLEFPFQRLFDRIDAELAASRYLIISLAVSGGWHNYVIFNKLPNGEYEAVTKGQYPERINNVCEIVNGMNGTDIIVYEEVFI